MRFLKLASNWLDGDRTDPFEWPYWIDISVSGSEPRVAISEGVAHGAMGGAFSPQRVVERGYETQIVGADGEWLLPFIRRLAAGETVTEAELIDEFHARHGRHPEAYDWDV